MTQATSDDFSASPQAHRTEAFQEGLNPFTSPQKTVVICARRAILTQNIGFVFLPYSCFIISQNI